MPKGRKSELFSPAITNVPNFSIPRGPTKLNSIFKKSIHDLEQGYLGSGSKVTQTQFLALRIVHPKSRTFNQFLNDRTVYGFEEVWAKATDLVNSSTEFQNYLTLIRNRTPVINIRVDDPLYSGSFKPVKRVQEQIKSGQSSQEQAQNQQQSEYPVARKYKVAKDWRFGGITKSRRKAMTDGIKRIQALGQEGLLLGAQSEASESDGMDETYTEDYGEAADEATPNAALVLLLQGISDLVVDSGMEWTFDHVHFNAKFNKGDFNTWTDGAFRPVSRDGISAIVEVKKRTRNKNGMETIIMQEGAELVGWLLSDQDRCLPDLNGHRVLVSQNYEEIWVTFANCHADYLEYLKKGTITPNAYLTMQTVGPFKVNDWKQMRDLAELITAITLKV